MSELPPPGARTKQVIELAEKVAKQPLPLRTRILLPAILAVVGVAAFWFGLRDDPNDPGPGIPVSTTIPGFVEPSVVFTAPP